MQRRTALTTIGTTAGLVLAGCLADVPRSTPDDPDDRAGNETNGTTPDGEDPGPIDLPDREDVEIVEATVDEPPHPIASRGEAEPDDPEAYDEHHLGAQMDTEPSVTFERLDGSYVGPIPLTVVEPAYANEYAVGVIASSEAEDELLDVPPAERPLVSYADSIVVAIHSGYGSGTPRHQWQRVEATPDGYHVHGYYTNPRMRTSDYTTRHSLVRIDRSDGDTTTPEITVSLTTDPDTRVTFDATADVHGHDG